ncbi:MAG: dihydrofolate reductase [Brotaphodocola sp.]
MKLIAVVDSNWAIGSRGQQLVNIPQDQKMFREMTLGKVIVMGRKTMESLPGGQPLYGRTNIVLTKDPNFQVKGAKICHSVDEVMELLKGVSQDDIYIIGGQTVYEQFLPFCEEALVTWIDYVYAADTYLPNLDKAEDWKLVEESDEQTYFNLCYTYRTYKKC